MHYKMQVNFQIGAKRKIELNKLSELLNTTLKQLTREQLFKVFPKLCTFSPQVYHTLFLGN